MNYKNGGELRNYVALVGFEYALGTNGFLHTESFLELYPERSF